VAHTLLKVSRCDGSLSERRFPGGEKSASGG